MLAALKHGDPQCLVELDRPQRRSLLRSSKSPPRSSPAANLMMIWSNSTNGGGHEPSPFFPARRCGRCSPAAMGGVSSRRRRLPSHDGKHLASDVAGACFGSEEHV